MALPVSLNLFVFFYLFILKKKRKLGMFCLKECACVFAVSRVTSRNLSGKEQMALDQKEKSRILPWPGPHTHWHTHTDTHTHSCVYFIYRLRIIKVRSYQIRVHQLLITERDNDPFNLCKFPSAGCRTFEWRKRWKSSELNWEEMN